MNGGFFYCFLYCLCAVIFRFWHPFFSVKGRENIERGKQYIICANHPGMADPIWMLLGMLGTSGVILESIGVTDIKASDMAGWGVYWVTMIGIPIILAGKNLGVCFCNRNLKLAHKE